MLSLAPSQRSGRHLMSFLQRNFSSEPRSVPPAVENGGLEPQRKLRFPIPGRCGWGGGREEFTRFVLGIDLPMRRWLVWRFQSALSEEALEDVHQDALVRLAVAWKSGPDPGLHPGNRGSYFPWLHAVWDNVAKGQLRRERKLRAKESTEGSDAPVEAESSMTETLEFQERLGRMQEILTTLKPKELRIVECELADVPPERAAELLGMSRAAYYKARWRLFSKLRAMFGDLEL